MTIADLVLRIIPIRRLVPPSKGYLASRSAISLQSELLRALFGRRFKLRLSQEQALVLSHYYRGCKNVCQDFSGFCGFRNKPTYDIGESTRMASLLDYFVAHIRVRIKMFPVFRLVQFRWSLLNLVHFILIVIRCRLYTPNRLYWLHYFSSPNFVSKNIYMPREEVANLMHRLKIAEDEYFQAVRYSQIDPVNDLYGEYIIQFRRLTGIFTKHYETLKQIKQLSEQNKAAAQVALRSRFVQCFSDINDLYSEYLEELKSSI